MRRLLPGLREKFMLEIDDAFASDIDDQLRAFSRRLIWLKTRFNLTFPELMVVAHIAVMRKPSYVDLITGSRSSVGTSKAAIGGLIRRGLILPENDPDDRRRKTFRLSQDFEQEVSDGFASC